MKGASCCSIKNTRNERSSCFFAKTSKPVSYNVILDCGKHYLLAKCNRSVCCTCGKFEMATVACKMQALVCKMAALAMHGTKACCSLVWLLILAAVLKGPS